MSHEKQGQSDEWYTPKYIFDEMAVTFDLDVSPARFGKSYVPSRHGINGDGIIETWEGFVWMNPPFGGRNGLIPWMDKFFKHGDGVALTPDRTSAPWWQDCAKEADAILFMAPKVKFIRPDGSLGKSPANGTTLFASGPNGVQALINGVNLGVITFQSAPTKSTEEEQV